MPDEEMIRRVDKAILEYIYARTGTMICNLSVAGVGIKAMREPTEKMMDAPFGPRSHRSDSPHRSEKIIWLAMIDAILK